MNINPRDQIIFRNLAALEEAGEQGFSTYHAGDIKTGSQEIKKSLHESALTINSLQNRELRTQAKELLKTANQAIREYMKNPTEDNLSILKTDVDSYKEFLQDHQS